MTTAGAGQLLFRALSALLCVVLLIVLLVVSLVVPSIALAQEGHPYQGTWRGTIGSGEQARPVVIVMQYDGDAITGLVNPGRNSYRFAEVEHDAANWLLDVTATTSDGVAIAFSATMHEIGARNRYLNGSWREAGQELPLRITRE